MMAIASKLTSIGIIAFSFAIGILSLYYFSDLTKDEKKKHLEELLSQIINFVLLIWLGKIILNISGFLSDPLSILAYPSDSKVFYFAIVFITVLLLYKAKRKNLHMLPLFKSFAHFFLISSFVYEFIQFMIKDNRYAFGQLLLLAVLIGVFFFLRERIKVTILLMVIVAVWSAGMIILGFMQPFITVFGYLMAPWFIVLFFVASMLGLTFKLRIDDI
ncbi:hypothetical protein GCM10010978_26110 [Compostibacillus humi]|uniref:Uncharacterized protein n=2 Tax=Compostibacillus humi TaxID=1245525 RepID=A0A8J2TPN7_9BACI|nr:hypothetical protein GCM10010978_26110 [Compostibacillus humi]